MYRVVIVDDEPIIVEGISRLVPWKKYECSVCACAYSGKEGLEVVRREKPDNDRRAEIRVSGYADQYSDRIPGF